MGRVLNPTSVKSGSQLILLAYAGSCRQRGHYTSKAGASTYGGRTLSNRYMIYFKNDEKTYASLHRNRIWIGPGIVQRGINVFHPAHHEGKLWQRCNFHAVHPHSTTGRFVEDRLHRWNRTYGNSHRADRHYPHSAPTKILDGALAATFPSSGVPLRSVHPAGDVNRTGRPPIFRDRSRQDFGLPDA